MNHISGVMVSVLTTSALDRAFEPWLDQIKDYEIVFAAPPLKAIVGNRRLITLRSSLHHCGSIRTNFLVFMHNS